MHDRHAAVGSQERRSRQTLRVGRVVARWWGFCAFGAVADKLSVAPLLALLLRATRSFSENVVVEDVLASRKQFALFETNVFTQSSCERQRRRHISAARSCNGRSQKGVVCFGTFHQQRPPGLAQSGE